MYNWSVDEKRIKKENFKAHKIWRLKQMINYGEAREKLNEAMVRKNWSLIKDDIDPKYRAYLELLLWPSRSKKAS